MKLLQETAFSFTIAPWHARVEFFLFFKRDKFLVTTVESDLLSL